MRIPSGVTDQFIYFVAVNSTDLKTRETGLSSFTVYYSRNGGAATAISAPTVNETDSTNMPGVYELIVSAGTTLDSGDDSQEMVLHITAAGMAPVTRTIEIYRPKVTAGETIGVSSGAITNVGTVATNSDKTGYSISGTKTTLDALNDVSTTDILGMTYESTEDFQDFLRLVRAVLIGKTSGAGTGTENFRDATDNKNRIVSTIDSNGDRTSITTDAT